MDDPEKVLPIPEDVKAEASVEGVAAGKWTKARRPLKRRKVVVAENEEVTYHSCDEDGDGQNRMRPRVTHWHHERVDCSHRRDHSDRSQKGVRGQGSSNCRSKQERNGGDGHTMCQGGDKVAADAGAAAEAN